MKKVLDGLEDCREVGGKNFGEKYLIFQ